MFGKIAKTLLKTCAVLGVGGFAVKTIFSVGYAVGQAVTETTFSLINEKEPEYSRNVLQKHMEIYNTAENISDCIDKTVNWTEELPMDEYILGNSSFSRGALYTSRYLAYMMFRNHDIKLQYVVYPHQQYLCDIITSNPELKLSVLQLRKPYDFDFDYDIMYCIAFKNNVFYDRSDLSFTGPSINIHNLGNYFWTDYNLIATLDFGLPGIDVGRYTSEQFIELL